MEDLINRYYRKELSASEEETLLGWRRASAANEAHYRESMRLLELAETALRARVPARPSVEAVTRRAARLAADGASPRRSHRGTFAIGALALATAAGLSFLVLQRSGDGTRSDGREFVTGSGDTTAVTLADGTVIRLAPNSRLRIVAAPGEREVLLEGRAFFAVAKDPDRRTFRVITASGVAEVLGTRFDLQARGDDVRLVVVEGSVALEGEGAPVAVGAGEMSRISNGAVSTPVSVDIGPMVAWLHRFIVFQSTPAAEVARELERVYGVRVEISDSALAKQTVTGTFSDRPFNEVFATVCEVLQTTCSVQREMARIGP